MSAEQFTFLCCKCGALKFCLTNLHKSLNYLEIKQKQEKQH